LFKPLCNTITLVEMVSRPTSPSFPPSPLRLEGARQSEADRKGLEVRQGLI